MPWLMKAEPDTRLEKGIDVKFSIDDFEAIGVSKWDGVRNHEAKKIMKEKMKEGDQVLFYHSNCKVPGVYGTAVVHRAGYPDFTAWDSAHPYFDAKSKQDAPTWFMVDVEFKTRLDHPVTLALLKHMASRQELPECVSYIGEQGHKAIREMTLVNRGRLSVQPVTPEAYEAILLLGKVGGWDELTAPVRKTAAAKKVAKPKADPKSKRKAPESGESPSERGQSVTHNDDTLPRKRKRVANKSSKASTEDIRRSSSELSDLPPLTNSRDVPSEESQEQPSHQEAVIEDSTATNHERPEKQKGVASEYSTASRGKISLTASGPSIDVLDLLDNADNADLEMDTLEGRKLTLWARGERRLLREEISSGRHPTLKPYRHSTRSKKTTST